jgi:hypothetical protein
LIVDEVTLVTVGAEVSMMSALLNPREPAAAGAGSVKIAALVAASVIVPVFNPSADVEV